MSITKRRALILALTLSCALQGSIGLYNGTKTVTSSGTAVALAASATPAVWVTVQALSSNTGTICVGGATVLASAKNGTCLTAGLAAPLYAIPGAINAGSNYDLSSIYIDATVSGEGVSFTYVR
jgi:hypothetical protein